MSDVSPTPSRVLAGTGRRVWRWVAWLCLAPAILGSALLTPRVGDQRIDVGLDVATPPASPPILRWDEAPGQDDVPMQRIAEAFSPRTGYFKITATGQSNPNASRAQVWVKDNFASQGETTQAPPNSWLERTGFFAHYGTDPSTLSWEGPNPPESLVFPRSATSGIATVTTLTGEQRLDLYSPQERDLNVPLPAKTMIRWHASVPRRALGAMRIVFPEGPPPEVQRLCLATWIPTTYFAGNAFPRSAWGRITENWVPRRDGDSIRVPRVSAIERGGLTTFAALALGLWGLAAAAAAAVGLGLWLAWRVLHDRASERSLASAQPRLFAAFFLAFALAWSAWLAAFYPAAMSQDSIVQWEQAHKRELSDAYALTLLLRMGVHWAPVALAFLAALLSVRNGSTAITLWKDVPYSVSILLLTALLARFRFEATPKWRWTLAIALGVLLGLTALFRHNGLVVLAGLLPLLFLFFGRWWRFVLISALVALLMCGAARWILFPLYGVAHFGNWTALTCIDYISPLVDQDVPFSQAEYEFLSQARSFEDRWDYNPVLATRLIEPPALHPEFVDQHAGELARLCASLLERYPLLMARARLRRLAFLYMPPQLEEETIPCAWLKIKNNRIHLFMTSRLPELQDWLKNLTIDTMRRPYNWLFWRPALHLWLVLIALIVLARRTKEYRLLIAYAPVLLNTISLIPTCFSQDARYQYPLTLAAGFLICLAFLPKAGQAPALGDRSGRLDGMDGMDRMDGMDEVDRANGEGRHAKPL
ncbi:MAG: hypothetical protein NTW86_20595 [Candidatus Sumerlaeota bacterium]|nr:hypothetical protein [Candidatus Sumerlaeota bacterium]